MTASVTDLQDYRRTHPPAVRCFNAMVRCWWKWSALSFSLWWLPRR